MAFQPLAVTRPVNTSTPKETHVAERVVLMCASALFAGLTPKDCYEIAACGSVRNFARDEILFMQGQPIRNLVLLQTGSVKLTQTSSEGNEVILWMNGEGEAIGVHAESPNCNHTCSARAMEQCRALTWEYSRIQAVLAEHPQIRKNISQILSSNLQELEERFREVATERVARRLALTLLRLLKHVGKEGREGVQLSLSREELAQMVGTTLFTISRILSKWGENGLVVPRREAVLIPNPARLRHMSGEE